MRAEKKHLKNENKNMVSYNLPPNWSWVKLGDVCYTTSGGTPSRGISKYYNGTIPWVKSGELDKGLILDTEEKISEEALKNSSAKIFPKDTLLIALYGATIGKLAFLGIDAATNQAVCGIYKNENIDSNFLFNFLFFKKQYLVKQSIGGAQPNISQGILKNLEIPLPPLPEQKKIVEKIEELFSGLDSGVASLKKAKEQIRLYRQSVLSAAFSGRLTQEARGEKQAYLNGVQGVAKAAEPKVDYSNQLPEGWKWVKLGEVVKIVSGNTPKGLESISNTGSLPFYKVSDMNSVGNERKMLKSNLYLTTEEMKKLKIKIYPKHTTIFPKRGGAILTNKKRLLATDSSFDLNLMGLIPSATVNYQFLHYWVIKLDLSTIYDGSNVPQINNKNVEPLDFPLPPLNQQTQIVEEIEKRFSEADNLEKSIDESLEKADRLRQSILKQAFEGKIVN